MARLKLSVKVYIPSKPKKKGGDYPELQGEDQDVPDDVNTPEDWERFKQKTIGDFINNQFKKAFEKAWRHDFDTFGIHRGTYKDNEMNRRLGRTGKSYVYDSGNGIRAHYRNAQVEIEGEDEALKAIGKIKPEAKIAKIPKYAKTFALDKGISSYNLRLVRFTRNGRKAFGFSVPGRRGFIAWKFRGRKK